VAESREAELAELAAALETLTQRYPDPVLLISAEGIVLAASHALFEQSGLPRERFIGSHFAQWSVPEERSHIAQEFEAALRGEMRRFRTRARDGTAASRAEITYSPVLRDDEVIAVLVGAFPLDEIEARERARTEADELLRIAGELASFGAFSLDRATQSVHFTTQALRVLGFEGDAQITIEQALQTFAPANGAEILEAIGACFEHGTPISFQSEILNGEGRRQFVRVVGEAVRDAEGGAVIAARGAIWDITASVEAFEREAALRTRLDETLDSIEDGFLFLDRSWRMIYANAQVERLIERPFAEIEGRSLWGTFPELADSELEVAYQRAARDQVRTTVRTPRADLGKWFDVTAYPTTTGIALYIRDVTEDELARQKITLAQRRIAEQAELIDAVRDAIIVRGLDGVVRYWNHAAETLYGVSSDEAIGQQIRELMTFDIDLYDEVTLRDGYCAEEVPHTTRDGRSLIVDCRWQLLRGPDGEPDAIMSIDTDVTQWRREENLRARATRMESLGTFAGGIAHDLNNVLTPILMSIQLLEASEQDEGRRELLATMESAARRGADMVRQVLSFARGVDGRRERVAIERLLDETRRFATEVLPASIDLTVVLDDDVPDTMGDSTQLVQVLSNLVTNARDAMPQGGRLQISASTLLLEDALSAESFRLQPGRYAVIDVTDTGHGMRPDVVEKIFEPFYTTKAVGKGTGLGLASSLAIMRGHGGTLRVYSEQGRGTRFSMLLPIVEGGERAARSHSLPERRLPRGHGELVLVVDDDATIRMIAARTLENYGYRTETAADGREAIACVERLEGAVDLVLTDMMMPVMDGAALTAHLEDHFPDLPIIAASGLTSAGGASRSAGMGVAAFLPKPYTTSLLLTTLRDVLDGSGRPVHDGQAETDETSGGDAA